MSALPLTALTVQPIRIPSYRNERIRDFGLWYRDNEPALVQYFNDLKPYAPEGTEPARDFFEFAAIQHETAEAKMLLASLGPGADFSPIQHITKSVAVVRSSADSARPAPRVPETGRGFQLKAFPPRGRAMVDAVDAVLARLPHTGDM